MTNNKQQTAVDFAFETLANQGLLIYNEYTNLVAYQEAKEMEKKQHKKTWLDSTSQFDNAAEMTFKKDFDEHYNETFGGGNNE